MSPLEWVSWLILITHPCVWTVHKKGFSGVTGVRDMPPRPKETKPHPEVHEGTMWFSLRPCKASEANTQQKKKISTVSTAARESWIREANQGGCTHRVQI